MSYNKATSVSYLDPMRKTTLTLPRAITSYLEFNCCSPWSSTVIRALGGPANYETRNALYLIVQLIL